MAGYVHVGVYQVSPDHKFLAYTIDVTGGEWFILKVKDLRSGTLQNLGVSGVVNLEWSRDGSTLFYTVADDTQRPYRQIFKLNIFFYSGASVNLTNYY